MVCMSIIQLKNFIESIIDCEPELAQVIKEGFNTCFESELAIVEGKLSRMVAPVALSAMTSFAGSKHKPKHIGWVDTHTPEQTAQMLYNNMSSGNISSEEALKQIKSMMPKHKDYALKTFAELNAKLGDSSYVKKINAPNPKTHTFDVDRKMIQTKDGEFVHYYTVKSDDAETLRNVVNDYVKSVITDTTIADKRVSDILKHNKNPKEVSFVLPL